MYMSTGDVTMENVTDIAKGVGIRPAPDNLVYGMNFLLQYCWMILVIIGLPGNFLTFLISMKEENRKLSISVFMAALAGADGCVLANVAVTYTLWFWTHAEYLNNLSMKEYQLALQ